MAKNPNECYARIATKLTSIETKIAEIETQLSNIRQGILNPEHEVTQLTEAEKAITALLDTESQGDA